MLEGTLVRLRAIEPEDAARMKEWMNDREVTRFLEGGVYPISLAEERRWAEDAGAGNSFVNVRLAIETKVQGLHIGNCGLHQGSPASTGGRHSASSSATRPTGRRATAPTQFARCCVSRSSA